MSSVPLNKPQPGRKFLVKERLGKGAWKEVYRAVARGSWRDVALARFQSEQDELPKLFPEFKNALRLAQKLESDYVAKVFDIFQGDDGRIYLAEELLERSLDDLSPLHSGERFLAIARDLSRGLRDLHAIGLVHRDLKLDNCGLDHLGRAKIFDLGAATSEGGHQQGTMLTRAPELLLNPSAVCTPASDVWSLGATLFALRTREYPFVTSGERLFQRSDNSGREAFRRMILDRCSAAEAQSELYARADQSFPADASAALKQTLAFDPSLRPTAAACADEWSKLYRNWFEVRPTRAVENDTETLIRETKSILRAFLNGEVDLSSKQWRQLVTAVEFRIAEDEDLRGLVERAQAVRAT